ncbi:hypothetical protein L829_3987 [Mycobacteroides abscessus MAB_030201_1075]|uniref:Uncharacterized protein n=1 Tax=Mycobacteroides abscessus MAB_030201_1075 TaxID=1335410 RepID=A0A829PTE9_9MYCO|nr:hypothetical protein L835_1077 [Mycobacteroides abscessus MAB_110811_1470]ETZ90403.1 hypothetical protein L829_3987 [Mycobacteroides abscessus MAB_030201_1075]ETZ92790.1 hypothetical protein L828_1112 [Mycobacteroides abscessus MAB_030201_1061]
MFLERTLKIRCKKSTADDNPKQGCELLFPYLNGSGRYRCVKETLKFR